MHQDGLPVAAKTDLKPKAAGSPGGPGPDSGPATPAVPNGPPPCAVAAHAEPPAQGEGMGAARGRPRKPPQQGQSLCARAPGLQNPGPHPKTWAGLRPLPVGSPAAVAVRRAAGRSAGHGACAFLSSSEPSNGRPVGLGGGTSCPLEAGRRQRPGPLEAPAAWHSERLAPQRLSPQWPAHRQSLLPSELGRARKVGQNGFSWRHLISGGARRVGGFVHGLGSRRCCGDFARCGCKIRVRR